MMHELELIGFQIGEAEKVCGEELTRTGKISAQSQERLLALKRVLNLKIAEIEAKHATDVAKRLRRAINLDQISVTAMRALLAEAASLIEKRQHPAKAPWHTDMMVAPEKLDAWLEENPLPPDTYFHAELEPSPCEALGGCPTKFTCDDSNYCVIAELLARGFKVSSGLKARHP